MKYPYAVEQGEGGWGTVAHTPPPAKKKFEPGRFHVSARKVSLTWYKTGLIKISRFVIINTRAFSELKLPTNLLSPKHFQERPANYCWFSVSRHIYIYKKAKSVLCFRVHRRVN